MALSVIPAGKIAINQLCYLSSQQDHEVWLQLCLPLKVLQTSKEVTKLKLNLLGFWQFYFRVEFHFKLHGSPDNPELMLRLTFLHIGGNSTCIRGQVKHK